MLYSGESVRLARELPDLALPVHTEGTVTRIIRDDQGYPLGAEVEFRPSSGRVTHTVPLDAVELVISLPGGCTAVLWDFTLSPDQLIEPAMHVMLDRDFEMREGPNLMQLHYNREERFWRNGERFTDPTGAYAATAGQSWDGCLVAFSGRQRFHLEFRLRGKGKPYLMVHQRYEAYQQQSLKTHEAMSLLRVLLNIYVRTGATYCAIPVASNWLMDESWDSLLQTPYFPDLFIVPQSRVPASLPPQYRVQRLVDEKAIMTTLPVKFAPSDVGWERSERELKLDSLRACKAIGEKAYDQLYETGSAGSSTGLYSDAKEAFYDAIRIANELGLKEESEELEKRLQHIKAVFRSQFS